MPAIECEWMLNKRIVVGVDGQVWPCCFFSNNVYERENTIGLDSWEISSTRPGRVGYYNMKIILEYYKNKDDYNIFKKPLEEIINSEWFTKTLPESWQIEKNTCVLCKRFCSVKS
ncbi:MAG: hypothetical protein CMI58_05595 [Parcubacteria group bacterium]|jgi:hypothetical protein|nr:hypothetical protein [Parcubacteria group bacterium]|tara:strand:+ start:875 stop:1219 length:345 start_codon:yes stop_codon:yes gene_type:complete